MWAPLVLLAPVILFGGLRLRPPGLVVLLIASVISVVYGTAAGGLHVITLLVLAAVALLAVRLASYRDNVGIRGLRGGRLLADLRDRLKTINRLTPLPKGWGGKAVARQAPGSLFSADLTLSHQVDDRLEVALVDVSGKGTDAASRALMIAGAFGGLLGTVPADRFLAACNGYLLDQPELEGIVTAVHLSLDLGSGRYTIRCAGHPPAARLAPGSGTWRLSDARGIALGVVPNAEWGPEQGSLAKGDALMLFTDGMWDPRLGADSGVDRLLGEAEILVTKGYKEAGNLVKNLAGKRDDCALVLIWRT
ncbi:PP2C family protein-serine/threonine phosphatase [Spongiactinospora sp. TRM90649]|uniref:PP2C family protein-serine/threonine phosphatase n=1 Tax=Spongiactinospora sp. TRM90649 TaxID=3031114 RepID=UPI0023F7ED97|nr:PP2C family protein-serine/threonine phosphatase [Spongiactinospora sp. TRM90649]MDF5758900.1 PP2C family protein-serine/threonine phosphatase [Spongiactinospora sp. TRM90649]